MTLALYGKSRRRQGALVLAGLLAAMLALMVALWAAGYAGAVTETLNPSSATCAEDAETPTADCDGDFTAEVQADDGNVVHVERDRQNDGRDLLSVTFDLSHIPAGSTLNSASVVIVSEIDTGDIGALELGEPGGNVREYGNQIPAGSNTYTTSGLENDVASAFGGTFTVTVAVDCDSADDDNCSVFVDEVNLDLDYEPLDSDGDGVGDVDDLCADTPNPPVGGVLANGCDWQQELERVGAFVDNPPRPTECGTNFSIVLDKTGSFSEEERLDTQDAAKGFVTDILTIDSTASFSVASFADATADAAHITASSDETAIHTAIDAGNTGGSTNWSAGMAAGNVGSPEWMLVFTDGNPNEPGGPGINAVDFESVAAAVNTAGTIKPQPTHITVIGINTSGNAPAGFGADAELFASWVAPGDVQVGSIADLPSILDAIRTDCAPDTGTIDVTKIVTNVDGDTTPFDFSFEDPTTSFTVIGDATASNPADPGAHTVTEAPEEGYTTLGWLIADVCPAQFSLDGDGVVGEDDTTAEVTVVAGETVNICFYNSLDPVTGGIVVHKINAGSPDDQADTFEVDVNPVNGGDDPDAEGGLDPNNPVAFDDLAPGDYTVIETPDSGYAISYEEGTCAPDQDEPDENGLELVSDSDGFTVAVVEGETTNVCITNTPVGIVRIVKEDQTEAGDTWTFDVTGPENTSAAIAGSGETDALTGAPYGAYAVTETNANVTFEACSSETPELNVFASIANADDTIDEPGEVITFTILNEDCSAVGGQGILVIEKFHDIDGDGTQDTDEPGLEDWDFVVTGPEFPGGETFTTDSDGLVTLSGIATGLYEVEEVLQSGWQVSALNVNGAAETPATDIAVVVSVDQVETEVEFGNRQTGAIRVTKTVSDFQGSATVAGWTFQLTGGCGGIATSATTGASGMVTFEGLEPTDTCGTPYLVSEVGANSDGFVTAPAATQAVQLGSGESADVAFSNTRGGSPPDPTPDVNPPATATPTNTTVPPANTPTVGPTETVAGEITPGPGSEATPIPPDAGTGRQSGAGGWSFGPLALGLVVLALGSGFMALSRKRSG